MPIINSSQGKVFLFFTTCDAGSQGKVFLFFTTCEAAAIKRYYFLFDLTQLNIKQYFGAAKLKKVYVLLYL